jgi:hypothetical protein
MKFTTLLLVLFLPISLYCQTNSPPQFDSVDVRIYNNGKHYIKKLIITVDNHEYQFNDICKSKYSKYLRLPFLWSSNKTEVTIVVKRMFKYDEWISMTLIPIDHVGESKFPSGQFTVHAEPSLKKGKMTFDSYVKKE